MKSSCDTACVVQPPPSKKRPIKEKTSSGHSDSVSSSDNSLTKIDSNVFLPVTMEDNPTAQSTPVSETIRKQARLDYFLISEDILTDVKDVVVKPSYRSDHSPVILHIQKEHFQRDRPFWKFNNSLLKDVDYVTEIKRTIIEVKKQYATLVYNFDDIDKIPNEDITLQIGDQLFFEALLLAIRGSTISFATLKKTLQQERELEKQIYDLEFNILDRNIQQLEHLKTNLQTLGMRELRVLQLGQKCDG